MRNVEEEVAVVDAAAAAVQRLNSMIVQVERMADTDGKWIRAVCGGAPGAFEYVYMSDCTLAHWQTRAHRHMMRLWLIVLHDNVVQIFIYRIHSICT